MQVLNLKKKWCSEHVLPCMYVLPRKILVALVGLESHDLKLLWSNGEGHLKAWQGKGEQEKNEGGSKGERHLFSGFSGCCTKEMTTMVLVQTTK